MRFAVLAAALLVSPPLCAQDKTATREKKAAAKKKPQATKEQIRRFNELEKKQQKK